MMTAGTADHAEVLAALHATSFPQSWSAEEFASLLRQPGVASWIVSDGREPSGFILIRAAADEAEILTLAVTPEHRRKGYAGALLHEAFAALSPGIVQQMFLEVAADNTGALALYERHGFTVCGRRSGYYAGAAKSIDAILMRRRLSADACC